MSTSEGTPLLRSSGTGEYHTGPTQRTIDYGIPRPTKRRRGRRWGGAAIVGAVMFAVAGGGLVVIFNAIRDATSETPVSLALDQMLQVTPSDGTHGNEDHERSNAGVTMAPAPSGDQPEIPGKHKEWKHTGRFPSNTGGHHVGHRTEVSWDITESNNGASTQEPGMKQAASKSKVDGNPSVGDRDETSTKSGVSSTKPNVFFIMIDDMGWNDIGYQSTDLWKLTPNLDKLASSGIKLTKYYTMSICTPARASLMTGRYTVRYGLQYNVIQPGAPWGLPLNEKILPEYMNDQGYVSHMVGKWHLGSYTHSHTPHQRGFKTFLGYLNDEEQYWTHQSWTATYKGRKFFDFGFGNETDYYDVIKRDGLLSSSAYSATASTTDDDSLGSMSSSNSSQGISSAEDKSYVGKYSTTLFTERVMEIIKSKNPFDDEPLFVYLAHQAVHDPLGLPRIEDFDDEDWALLDSIRPTSPVRKRFAKVLFYLDKMIGTLVEQLEQENWLENSIIVVASDNGGCPTNGGSNYPLRGIKHSYWEGGTKVPAMIYSKSHLPESVQGTSYDGLMHVTDWLPTLMSAVGGNVSGSAGPLDGVDHWEYFAGGKAAESEASPRTELLYNWDPYILWTSGDAIEDADYPLSQGAYRQGKYKLLSNVWCSGYYTFDPIIEENDENVNTNNTCQDMGTCCNCGQACLGSVNYTDWLFDLESDPREEYNLINEFPELAGEMRERAIELAFSEWKNSSYKDINRASYRIWSKMGWWMVPWYHLYNEGFAQMDGMDDDDGDDDEVSVSTSTSS